jgi:multidrug efflux pump subunit AcrB
MFFLNYKNGVNYNIVAQSPQYDIQSLNDLQNIPLSSPTAASSRRFSPMWQRSRVRHRDAGDLALQHPPHAGYLRQRTGTRPRLGWQQIQKIVDANKKDLPRGSFLRVRGQIETMNSSYFGLIAGLAFAIVLVYLLIVVNFQSWLDPFIIITALPAALAGIVMFLFSTHTTLSVPALMGAIMCMGVATANSILVVSFAKDRLNNHGDAVLAAIEAGATRFRPVMMTALAMIIGMIPMALGAGEGGEQNAPLGRAVIGGLFFATIATLIFVPASSLCCTADGSKRHLNQLRAPHHCRSLKTNNEFHTRKQ